MSRLINLALAVSAAGIAMTGLQAAPAHAATTTSTEALLVGELGYEGGAYPLGSTRPLERSTSSFTPRPSRSTKPSDRPVISRFPSRRASTPSLVADLPRRAARPTVSAASRRTSPLPQARSITSDSSGHAYPEQHACRGGGRRQPGSSRADSGSRWILACPIVRRAEAGQVVPTGPVRASRTGTALRNSGTTASTRPARSKAGIVTVTACVGTESRSGSDLR